VTSLSSRQQPFDVVLPPRPYPGLRPFDKREWPVFFGRERMVDEVISRTLIGRLVVVHGDSGCGKSSLIKAGVLALLEQESARGGLAWRTCEMQPRDAPLYSLARALAGLEGTGVDGDRVIEIRRTLNFGANAPAALIELLRRGNRDHICVLIDQFEELFTFARRSGREEAALFVQFLAAILNDPPPGLYAIVTMRSEFLGACAQFPGLAEAVNRAQYLLPRMMHVDLLRAIREPARLYGGEVTRALAERLVTDGGETEDELPLIQHGLMLLSSGKLSPVGGASAWQLDVADYETHGGGLKRLLSEHADRIADRADLNHTGMVEQLFRALTEINAEGHAIRRPQRFAELCRTANVDASTFRRVIDAFRADDVSFIRPFGDTAISDDTTIDIGHEALIRSWDRIADPEDGWLVREFEDGLVWKSLLVQAASFERDSRNVLSPATAREREPWLARHNHFWAERYGDGWDRVSRLVSASVRAASRERLLRRVLMSAVFVAAIFFAAAWMYAKRNQDEAERQRLTASSLAQAALARQNIWLHPELAAKYGLDSLKYDGLVRASGLPEIREVQEAVRDVLDESNVIAVWSHPQFAPISGAGFTPDGEQILLSTTWGPAWLWAWKGCDHSQFVNNAILRLRATSVSPDSRFVFSEEEKGGRYTLIVRRTSDGQEQKRWLPQIAPITAVAFSRGAGPLYAATGSADSSVRIWNLEGDLRLPVKSLVLSTIERNGSVVSGGHRDIVTSVRFASSDPGLTADDIVVTASQDGRSKVWHWMTDHVETLRARTFAVFDALTNPAKPEMVASGDQQGNLFLWTLSTPPKTREYTDPHRVFAHKYDVRQVSFSPDGTQIVTASVDGTAKVWDWRKWTWAEGERKDPILTLRGHHGAITSADFSPDGRLIVTASVDGTVRVWSNTPPVSNLTRRPPAHSCRGSD